MTDQRKTIALECFDDDAVVMQLRALCTQHNIVLIERANGHFQLFGACSVNYWPLSRHHTIYNEEIGKIKGVDPEQAIALVNQPLEGHKRSSTAPTMPPNKIRDTNTKNNSSAFTGGAFSVGKKAVNHTGNLFQIKLKLKAG